MIWCVELSTMSGCTVSLGEIKKHPKQIEIEINHIANERSRAAL